MLRNVIRTFRRRLKQSQAHRQRAAGKLQGVDWKSGLDEENDFWEKALSDPAKNWDINEFKERTNPDFELQPELRALIPASEGETVRILDVGAGPLTRIGKKWPGHRLEIIATDPLAEKYNALVTRLNVPLLVPVTVAHAEKLTETFPKDHFDLAYASNCLDHSYDPILAIRQMVEVVKPGCSAYLWHFTNVGKAELYAGLHQWNFDVVKGEFTVSDGRVTHVLREKLAAGVRIECERIRAFDAPVVIARIKKNA